jgi:hypothetical protein
MFNFTQIINRKILLLMLLSFSSASHIAFAQGANNFQASGEILELSSTTINVGDMAFRLSPTVKVQVLGKKQASTNDLKVGDYVGIKLIMFNGKHLVDSIQYLPGQLNNE